MTKYRLLLSCLILYYLQCEAQSVAQTRCNNLGKGVNLSNWLEGYWETDWPDSTVYNEQFLIDMKAAGMKSVRMPVCFELVCDSLPPYTVDTSSRVFQLIDSVITWTHNLDMNLIIDNHHLWYLSDSTFRIALPRMAHLWSVLAQRYSYLDPDKYFFEILNEPEGISNDSLALFFTPIIDSIRQYAPFHSIVVGPSDWSNGVIYLDYQPLADTNLLYTFHCYDPYQFTEQGLSFNVPPLPTGVPFPGSPYDFELNLDWKGVMLWEDSFHMPLFMGEFGVGIGADAQSRCNWMDTMSNYIAANQLSSFYWDVTTDFRIYDSGVTIQDSIIPCFEQAMHLYGDTLTSVQNLPAWAPMEIYPNPSKEFFSCIVQSGRQVEMEIYDSPGRKIFETKFLSRYQVNTRNWAGGIYFVKLRTEGAVNTFKIIIQ